MSQQFNESRQSWGLFVWNDNGDGQFIRIIDYVTDSAGNGCYDWVAYPRWWERSRNPSSDDPLDPKTLYNPKLTQIMVKSDSDFKFLQWTPNYNRPDHPFVEIFQGGLRTTEPPLYEVIDCPANRAEELPDVLSQGIQYSGRPTAKILLLFAENNNMLDAAVLDRSMTTIHNGLLTLSNTAPNSVPRVILDRRHVRIINQGFNRGDRLVYNLPTQLKSHSQVVIKPMRDLAQLYVNWYIRKEHAMNGDELMRTAGDVLEQAFEKPANLEEYLGAKPSHNDVRALQTAIKATIRSNTDDVSEIIYDVLKNDEDVMAEFRKQATAQLDDEFEKHKQVLCKQLDELRAQRDEESEKAEQATAQLAELNQQLQRKRGEIRDAQAELELQKEEQHKALQDLENNVALKLGLQQIAQQNHSMMEELTIRHSTAPDSSRQLRMAPMMGPAKTQAATDMQQAVAQNMQILGCTFTGQSNRNNERITHFAAHLCRTLRTTRLLAVDTVHVPTIANTLAFALAGTPAQHTGIPIDFSDFTMLEEFLEHSESPVIVLDNVFDTVNESLLFALNRYSPAKSVVILPIGSFANIRLLAPEVWNKVFYVPTTGMVELSASDKPLHHAQEALKRIDITSRSILAQMDILRRMTSIPQNALVTPSAITAIAQDTASARQWIMPHLCIETYEYQGAEKAHELSQEPTNKTIAAQLAALIDRIDHGSQAR